jgi:hypothetical protein
MSSSKVDVSTSTDDIEPIGSFMVGDITMIHDTVLPTIDENSPVDITANIENIEPITNNKIEWRNRTYYKGSPKSKSPLSNTCSICLQKMSSNVIMLKCNHKFDHECIGKWIQKSRNDNRTPHCPMCRVEISPNGVYVKKKIMGSNNYCYVYQTEKDQLEECKKCMIIHI